MNADEVITCEEEPTLAIRRKPQSSICVAFKELKEKTEELVDKIATYFEKEENILFVDLIDALSAANVCGFICNLVIFKTYSIFLEKYFKE